MARALFLLLAACGGTAATPDGPGSGAIDAPTPVHVDDGTPMRRTCTNQFGSALTTTFGRLDGILVAVVPPGGGGCNADSSHVHLQIEAGGAVYDVAINVDGAPDVVDSTTRDIALPGPAWAEGWHTGLPVDYVTMGVHSADLAATNRTQLTSDLMTDLATVNHISVFGIGYGPDGAHNVHRNGSSHDGLVITEPLSTPTHARLFAFSNQSF